MGGGLELGWIAASWLTHIKHPLPHPPYPRCLPRRALRQWRAGVQQGKEQRWKEFRKQLLRDKVKGMLVHSRLEACLGRECIGSVGTGTDNGSEAP